ncbi:MAG: YcxB family protein [Ruminococcus sp.]|nr:YcxB family protein [Ruminococcus sp.]
MEENYKLVKEYKVPHETFKKAYKAYQKKFVRTKSIIFTLIFLILAADFVYAAVKAPDNRLVYLLIMVCIALAFREWYNSKRIYQNICDSYKALGEPLYRIAIGEEQIEISTVSTPDEDTDEEDAEEDIPEENELSPESSVIKLDEDYGLLEYDEFFLLMQGKAMFYILPKKGFSEEELETVRSTGKKNSAQ